MSAIRLDPFRTIVGVAWPPAGFTLPFLERVFVSDVVDLSAAPVGFGCPGGNPPSGFFTQTQRFSQVWVFHFRATPTSPVMLILRVRTLQALINNAFVCVSPVNRRAEASETVRYQRVTTGHTHPNLAAFTFTEIAGDDFTIPLAENVAAWPQPDWLVTGLPTRQVLLIAHSQKRELFPGALVTQTAMRWDQYALAPGSTLVVPSTTETSIAFEPSPYLYAEGVDSVAPGLDQAWWQRFQGQMAP